MYAEKTTRTLAKTLGNLPAQLQAEVVLNKLALKASEKKVQTLLYTPVEKKSGANKHIGCKANRGAS